MATINPLSRREVIKFGAFTTVGGVLTPGISMAQAKRCLAFFDKTLKG